MVPLRQLRPSALAFGFREPGLFNKKYYFQKKRAFSTGFWGRVNSVLFGTLVISLRNRVLHKITMILFDMYELSGHDQIVSGHDEIFGNKWFPWAFWWNLFEPFICNGDLPMTFARPRFARRSLASLGGASLRSAEPRWSLASLGGASLRLGLASPRPRFARLEASENGTPSGEPSGGLHPRIKVLWTSGVVPPEGKIWTCFFRT